DMYTHHGFLRDGEEFLDDGIPHVPMLRARRETEDTEESEQS
ncbi:MAG TPA: GNAT family N-acetyltransferase, partial [Mycobacterium sp.]